MTRRNCYTAAWLANAGPAAPHHALLPRCSPTFLCRCSVLRALDLHRSAHCTRFVSIARHSATALCLSAVRAPPPYNHQPGDAAAGSAGRTIRNFQRSTTLRQNISLFAIPQHRHLLLPATTARAARTCLTAPALPVAAIRTRIPRWFALVWYTFKRGCMVY